MINSHVRLVILLITGDKAFAVLSEPYNQVAFLQYHSPCEGEQSYLTALY